MVLPELARRFINRYQGGVPIEERPFARMSEVLQCAESELLTLVGGLVDEGVLSRFGPIYNASRLGGGQTLAALTAPEARFDAVAEVVNSLPAVAHNYRREHRLNMWFVVAASTPAGVTGALAEIERATGLRVYNFPKLHEFYLGLWLNIGSRGELDTVPVPVTAYEPADALDATDFAIIAETQSGLPLVERPAELLASALGVDATEILERMRTMLAGGVIRRVGAVPNHYRLGLRGNGMTVWDVPDEMAVELGERVGALDFVSHSYLRPRYPGAWPYNLFAMVHGRGRDAVRTKAERIAALLGAHCRAHDVLFSSRVLKKTGLRLAA